MEINFTNWNKELSEKVSDFELAYGEIQDKIMNENINEIHTMLMKNDFEQYLQTSVFDDDGLYSKADLTDYKNYEKELK